jgi:glycosyltransferase involved in cell wall biosynthesis
VTLVSVVIPTRDRAELVSRAVDSVLAQTHDELEVIVVDDASRDDTVDRLTARGDDRLTVIRRVRPSGGASVPRSQGMARARGEWIAFVDSDDEWKPDKVATQLDAAGPDAALVYSRIDEVHRDGARTVYPTREAFPLLPTNDVASTLLRGNFVATSTMMVARPWARRVGEFEPRMVGSEDWEWCLRIALAGGRYAAVDGATATYHFHDRNISYDLDWAACDLAVYRAIRPIAGDHRADIDRRIRELRRDVRRAQVRSVVRRWRPTGTHESA